MGSMLGQMDISSLLGRVEASNGRCLGGQLADLCMFDVQTPKREGGVGLGALTLDTCLDAQVDGQLVSLMVPRLAEIFSPCQSHPDILLGSRIQYVALSVPKLFVVHFGDLPCTSIDISNYEYLFNTLLPHPPN